MFKAMKLFCMKLCRCIPVIIRLSKPREGTAPRVTPHANHGLRVIMCWCRGLTDVGRNRSTTVVPDVGRGGGSVCSCVCGVGGGDNPTLPSALILAGNLKLL